MKGAILLCLVLLLPTGMVAQEVDQNRSLVFNDVTVVDVKNGRLNSGMTVIVTGEKIAAVGRTGKVKLPKGAEIVDARGKFLIPGLWDMHVHALTDNRYEWVFPLLLANGVTGIREMGHNLPIPQANEIRRSIAEGKLPGPRFGAATARILDGAETRLNVAVAVKTAPEARAIVHDYKQQGVDFIKPYNLLSRDVYLALVDEAKRLKIPLEGHVPFSMTAAEVSDLGQKIIEHNFGLLVAASRDEAALGKALQDDPARWALYEAKAALSFDERKASRLFVRLARNGTWSCPTIVAYRLIIHFDDENFFLRDDRLKYVPPAVRERWHAAFEQRKKTTPDAENRVRWQIRSRIVPMMHKAGVPLMAGSDTADLYVIPGFSLHDELQLMVEAGLSPIEALRTATVNPAGFLGKAKQFGTVEQGKFADLVLLDADPLEDIKNTTKIAAVVANGKYFPRSELDKLLAQAEAAAKK